MSDHFNRINSETRAHELHLNAERWRLAHPEDDGQDAADDISRTADDVSRTLVIRAAHPADIPALDRISQVDGRHPPVGSQVLVAEVDGEVMAALPLSGGEPIADPFQPTSELVEMLRLRAGQLREQDLPRRGLRARLSSLLRGERPAMAPATPGNAAMLIPRD
jgi:hypothetical protein